VSNRTNPVAGPPRPRRPSRTGLTQSVHLPGAAVEASDAYLSVRTPYYPMLFAPAQGQSVPAAVAALTGGLA